MRNWMKHIFIINPIAGRSDMSCKLIPQIQKLKGIEKEIILTGYEGHARVIAKQYAECEEPVRIYACGGDGTLNEVMNGAYGHENVEVGCLPYGTGNDYVKNFGTADDFRDIQKVVAGKSIEVDMLETKDAVAAEICTAGFDANVGYSTRHYKKLPLCHGKMAYNLAVVECLLHPIGTELKITVDGEVYEEEFLMMCLANGTTYGGGFRCAPEANVCDGFVDVIIVKKVSRFLIAKIIAKYADGSYQKNGKVNPEFAKYITYLRGKHVTVEGVHDFVTNLDGECKVQREIDVKVMPKSLKFILPEGMTYC